MRITVNKVERRPEWATAVQVPLPGTTTEKEYNAMITEVVEWAADPSLSATTRATDLREALFLESLSPEGGSVTIGVKPGDYLIKTEGGDLIAVSASKFEADWKEVEGE